MTVCYCMYFQDEELGAYTLQQNVGGHPVAVYRFPNKLKCGANEVITVWSGANDYQLHQPPSDFVFKEQQKWGTGPECTTILCKPNGQVGFLLIYFIFFKYYQCTFKTAKSNHPGHIPKVVALCWLELM